MSHLNGGNADRTAPTLTSASINGSTTIVAGDLTALPDSTVRVEFFSDAGTEGQTYLGTQTVSTNGAGNASFNTVLDTTVPHQNVTATVTDADGNTSRFSSPVVAIPSGQVTVTINEVNEIDDFDVFTFFNDEADWGAIVTIDGQTFNTGYIENNNNPRPTNWQFSQDVTGTNVPISIQLQESDPIGLESGDINPTVGEDILTLNLNTLTGEVTGPSISSSIGNEVSSQGGEDALAAKIWFTVDFA